MSTKKRPAPVKSKRGAKKAAASKKPAHKVAKKVSVKRPAAKKTAKFSVKNVAILTITGLALAGAIALAANSNPAQELSALSSVAGTRNSAVAGPLVLSASSNRNNGGESPGNSGNNGNSGNSNGQVKNSEIKTSNGQKITTRVEEDGSVDVTVDHGRVQVEYRAENGRMVKVVHGYDTDNNEVEIDLGDSDQQLLEASLDKVLEKNNVGLTLTADQRLAILNTDYAALSDFPISVDAATGLMIVTTPHGSKVVTVLPSQAVANMIANGVVNIVGDVTATNPTDNTPLKEELEADSGVVQLEEHQDVLSYKVSGMKTFRLLGLFDVDQPRTVWVSTEDGTEVAREQSWWTSLIEFLSTK